MSCLLTFLCPALRVHIALNLLEPMSYPMMHYIFYVPSEASVLHSVWCTNLLSYDAMCFDALR
jgi:hypothetical protein